MLCFPKQALLMGQCVDKLILKIKYKKGTLPVTVADKDLQIKGAPVNQTLR